VLIAVAVGLLVDRKIGFLPTPSDLVEDKKLPPPHRAGEAPATAIRAREGQLAKLRAQRCTACRRAMTNLADDAVRYNERDLLVLAFSCPACAAKRVLYVERTA